MRQRWFTVLALSVVYWGCAIPVAWVVVSATEKGRWRPHWEGLLRTFKGLVPADWTVLVLADRGLYASWLYEAIVDLDWHPFLRINHQGRYRRVGRTRWRPLGSVVSAVGTAWCGEVECVATAPLRCTLLATWDAGRRDPWLILTDLAPRHADVVWYSLRTWIECGFTHTKRSGWQWQQTKMSDPARASRLWLALAVATLWVVSVGGAADAALSASSLEALPALHVARRRPRATSRPRLLSCFRQGLLTIRGALLAGRPLPPGRFVPEPWPTRPTSRTAAFSPPPRLAA